MENPANPLRPDRAAKSAQNFAKFAKGGDSLSQRGRKPKPTSLKVLEGNPGKRPLPQNEPKPRPIAPQRPSWLTGEGKKMWDKLAPELERLGLLTTVDGEAFAAACQCWKIFVDCQRYLKKYGMTYTYINKAGAENELERPHVRIAQKALDQFKAFCTEFGLTPSSRTRIDAKQPEEEDPMEALLSGVK